MNLPVLTPTRLHELAPFALDSTATMGSSTPLVYYVPKETAVMEGGLRLGPVGGDIVGKVLVGML